MSYFIYELRNNDQVFYIGLTSNLTNRLKFHKQKFGKDVTIHAIEKVQNRAEAFAREIFWMNKYESSGVKLSSKKAGRPTLADPETRKVVIRTTCRAEDQEKAKRAIDRLTSDTPLMIAYADGAVLIVEAGSIK